MEVIWTIWKAIFYLLLALFISVHMNPHCARTCTVQATTDGAGYIQNYFAERPALKSHILWALTLSETLKIGHFCQIFCKVFINHFFPNYTFLLTCSVILSIVIKPNVRTHYCQWTICQYTKCHPIKCHSQRIVKTWSNGQNILIWIGQTYDFV